MPGPEDFPEELKPYFDAFQQDIDALMLDLENEDITLDDWRDSFAEFLAVYVSAAYFAGQLAGGVQTPPQPAITGGDLIGAAAGVAAGAAIAGALAGAGGPRPPAGAINGEAQIWLENWLAGQIDYLNGFHAAIAANRDAGGEFSPAWNGRARMYATSIVAPYWFGDTAGLPLPALPGDGSSDCHQNDACGWVIEWIDRDRGDADCYWRLNQTRIVVREHCQQCVERADKWNPLRVREWRLDLPPMVKEESLKHHPGGKAHNQAAHGLRKNAQGAQPYAGKIEYGDDYGGTAMAQGGRIVVDREKFSRLDPSAKRQVIAHEMMHEQVEDYIIHNPKEMNAASAALTLKVSESGMRLFIGGETRLNEAVVEALATYLRGGDFFSYSPRTGRTKVDPQWKKWAKGAIARSGNKESDLRDTLDALVKSLESQDATGKETSLKHLAGQHDQSLHGHRAGGDISKALAEYNSEWYDDKGNRLSVYGAVELGKTNPLSGNTGDKFYTEVMGNSKEDYDAVKRLLSDHGLGNLMQQNADAELIRLYGDPSPKGKVLRDIAKTETALLSAYHKGDAKRTQIQIDRLRSDFEFEKKYGGYSGDNLRDLEDTFNTKVGYLRSGSAPKLYRKGDIGKGKVESWTTNGSGAWVGNLGRLRPDHAVDIGELLAQGYVSLGGIGRMMGAPGESEVTMFRPGKSKETRHKHLRGQHDQQAHGGHATIPPKLPPELRTGSSGAIQARQRERVAAMQEAYPGVKFSTAGSNPLGVADAKKAGIPGAGTPRAIFDPKAAPVSDPAVHQKIRDSFAKIKKLSSGDGGGSGPGYVTFNNVKFDTGLSFQDIFGALNHMRAADARSVRFTVDRMGQNTAFALPEAGKEFTQKHLGGKHDQSLHGRRANYSLDSEQRAGGSDDDWDDRDGGGDGGGPAGRFVSALNKLPRQAESPGNYTTSEGHVYQPASALRLYHKSGYGPINDRLRTGAVTDKTAPYSDPDFLDWAARAIDSQAVAMPGRAVVYRGIHHAGLRGQMSTNPKGMVGQRFTDKGYSSTTLIKETAESFAHSNGKGDGVVFRITMPKGTRVIPGNPSEYEIIARRNAVYTITGVDPARNLVDVRLSYGS